MNKQLTIIFYILTSLFRIEKKSKRFCWFCLVSIYTSAFTQVRFENLTTTDGLSQSTVLSICQDSLGFIWLGTAHNGLNRYDGQRFVHFRHSSDNFNSLSSNNIKELLADKNGSIWIGTDYG